jgi:hypothetical protein
MEAGGYLPSAMRETRMVESCKEAAMAIAGRVTVGLCGMLGILALSACGLAPNVTSDAVSYHESADVVANRIILLNVLRAKDNAPLHFGELSLVHGQVSEQAGVGVVQPFGMVPKSSSLPRATISPLGNVADQAAFDLGTLDTQTFTKGVTEPISPQMLKYFIDNGVDHRLVLMLLLAGARLPGGHEPILNFPRSERVVCYRQPPVPGELPPPYELERQGERAADCQWREREFLAFLRIMNGLRRVYAVSHRPFIPLGQPFRPDAARSLHDLMALDPAKHQVRRLPDGRVQLGLEAPQDEIVLCEERPGNDPVPREKKAQPDGTASEGVCGTGSASLLDGGPGASTGPDFTVRSTLGIFSFLGQVLGSQERRSAASGKDICIRLDEQAGFERDPDCSSGQVLFHLTHDRLAARFGVDYEGRFWGVPKVPPCVNATDHCDHTLETLSMLSLLLNLNKSARDIPSTPAVQLID